MPVESEIIQSAWSVSHVRMSEKWALQSKWVAA